MQTSTQKTSKLPLQGHQGFSLIEIMVALLLAALVFLAIPSGDSAQKHRELKTAVNDIDRAGRFASNEAILRNTVVRLRLMLDKNPSEYTIEYGPPGNLPLPEMPEKTSPSLAEIKEQKDKLTALNRQFNKVEEFEDVKQEVPSNVSIIGAATTAAKGIKTQGDVSIYFYPTGEKDGALIFFSTTEEFAFLEIAPFLSESQQVFDPIDPTSVAKLEDLLQTKMDGVYQAWGQ